MDNIVFAGFFLLFLGVVYAFGYTYAGVQAKKVCGFRAAFGRSFRLIVIMTVLFSIPMTVALALSAESLPAAYVAERYNTWAFIDTAGSNLFQVFGMLGLPFFAGVYRRYNKAEPRP